MRIALSGYGKMGKIIEQVGRDQHSFPLKIDADNSSTIQESSFQDIDVLIDFSTSDTAYENIEKALRAGIPVVSGTTGWNDSMSAIEQVCKDQKGAFLYSSNFSVGMNLFFALNKHLAQIMNDYTDYSARIVETHHIEKKDAPSGTAISLANDLIEQHNNYDRWKNAADAETTELSIISNRMEQVPGTHEIQYRSSIDDITIKHIAHNREGFAKGALLAAEWLTDKQGVFSMKDVLRI